MKTFFILLAFLLLISVGYTKDTPEEVFKKYFSFLQKGDLENSTKLIHSKELEKFKKMFLPLFDSTSLGKQDDSFNFYFGLTNIKEAKKQSPHKFYINFYIGANYMQPGLISVYSVIKPEIIGSVYDKKKSIHFIVYYAHINFDENLKTTKVMVQPISKENDNYKIMLTGEVKGIAESIKNRFQKKNKKKILNVTYKIPNMLLIDNKGINSDDLSKHLKENKYDPTINIILHIPGEAELKNVKKLMLIFSNNKFYNIEFNTTKQ